MNAINTALPSAQLNLDAKSLSTAFSGLQHFRSDCLKALSRNPQDLYSELHCFFDGFFQYFPSLNTYSKMAQLAGVSRNTIRNYYKGKTAIPLHVWHTLLRNAIGHIIALQFSLSFAMKKAV